MVIGWCNNCVKTAPQNFGNGKRWGNLDTPINLKWKTFLHYTIILTTFPRVWIYVYRISIIGWRIFVLKLFFPMEFEIVGYRKTAYCYDLYLFNCICSIIEYSIIYLTPRRIVPLYVQRIVKFAITRRRLIIFCLMIIQHWGFG